MNSMLVEQKCYTRNQCFRKWLWKKKKKRSHFQNYPAPGSEWKKKIKSLLDTSSSRKWNGILIKKKWSHHQKKKISHFRELQVFGSEKASSWKERSDFKKKQMKPLQTKKKNKSLPKNPRSRKWVTRQKKFEKNEVTSQKPKF